jgi:hypothetical protein
MWRWTDYISKSGKHIYIYYSSKRHRTLEPWEEILKGR